MKHTEHYQLSQFEKDDLIQMEDFNDNNAKIDTALKAHDTAIGAKANSATVGALTTRVGNLESGKAEASALSAEASARESADIALGERIDSEVAAREAAVNAIAANLGAVGKNLRICTGSYVGNGTYGSSNPTSLTFPFKPIMIFVSAMNDKDIGNGWMMRPLPYGCAANEKASAIAVTWGDDRVSWYTTATTNPNLHQSNRSGYTYYWFALGYDLEEEG